MLFQKNFNINEISRKRKDSLKIEYLKTFNQIYSVKSDSVQYASDFKVSQGVKKQLGFVSYLKIDSLKEGKHFLRVFKNQLKDKDTSLIKVSEIPFWYFRGSLMALS